MTSVERLISEHEHLDALATRLEECVAATAPDAELAVTLKARLSVSLADHLSGEDSTLYPRLVASAEPALVDTAHMMQNELAVLKLDWATYLSEWSDDVVEADWAAFGEDTRAMMARLRARIARENACLVPIALQRSMVRLRAA